MLAYESCFLRGPPKNSALRVHELASPRPLFPAGPNLFLRPWTGTHGDFHSNCSQQQTWKRALVVVWFPDSSLTGGGDGGREHHLPSPRHALQRQWNQTTLVVVTSGHEPSKALRFQPSHSTSSSSDQARPREQLGCVRHVMTVLYTYNDKNLIVQATPPQECENVRMRTCRASAGARNRLRIKFEPRFGGKSRLWRWHVR